VVEALVVELARFAGWLGLSAVAPPDSGDLADRLGKALVSAAGVR
jgi:uncharacterized protein YcaQ